MTELTIKNLNKWLHQNQAEVIDSFPGCLQDYYLVTTKNGRAYIYENYVNSNNSNHCVRFYRNGSNNRGEHKDLIDWYYLKSKAYEYINS